MFKSFASHHEMTYLKLYRAAHVNTFTIELPRQLNAEQPNVDASKSNEQYRLNHII